MLTLVAFASRRFVTSSQRAGIHYVSRTRRDVIPHRVVPFLHTLGNEEKRIYFKDKNDDLPISPWHDIPLFVARPATVWFVNEMPRGTTAKLEISVDDQHNPIVQDRNDNGSLRDILYGPVLHNYGALPRTWEDPTILSENVGFYGDGDPLDAIDIGSKVLTVGEIIPLKILGVVGLIDQNECDWKLIGINGDDSDAAKYNDIGDVSESTLESITHWYRMYKTAEGKPENEFAFRGAKDRDYAVGIIEECHAQWKNQYDK